MGYATLSRTKELHYTMSVTVNLSNYENARIEVGEIVELEKGDDRDAEMKSLISRVTKLAEKKSEGVRVSMTNEKE